MSSITAWNSLKSRFSSSRAWTMTTASPSRPKAPCTISVVLSASRVRYSASRPLAGRSMTLSRKTTTGPGNGDDQVVVAVQLQQPDPGLMLLVREPDAQQVGLDVLGRLHDDARLVDRGGEDERAPLGRGRLGRGAASSQTTRSVRQQARACGTGNRPDVACLRPDQAAAPRRHHHGWQRPLGPAPGLAARRGAPPRRSRRARGGARRARGRPARADAVRVLVAELAAPPGRGRRR